MRSTLAIFFLGLTVVAPACEPHDTPGGELTEIRLELVGRNPGADGRYAILVGERAALRGTGYYDRPGDGGQTEENITLSLFWRMQPGGPATIECQQDDLGGNRVVIEGVTPGIVEVNAFTREVEDSQIPCSPTPDGGWSFPDAGPEWPLQSDTIEVEVR